MKVILLPVLLTTLLMANSCKREKDLEPDEKYYLDGKTFAYNTKEYFDDLADLSEWNQFTGGNISIDTTEFYQGNSSFKLISDTSCFHVEKVEGVPVDQSNIYVIHFYYKLPITTIQELNNGWGFTCMAPFHISLKQGNTEILSEFLQETNNWTEKYYYFQPINNVPVKIEFMIGTKKGIWLDNLITLQQID